MVLLLLSNFYNGHWKAKTSQGSNMSIRINMTMVRQHSFDNHERMLYALNNYKLASSGFTNLLDLPPSSQDYMITSVICNVIIYVFVTHSLH